MATTAVAKYGEKMIELRVRFWTNDIAPERGEIVAKHAWTSGMVTIDRNASHGIRPEPNPIPFNSLLDLGAAVEKVLHTSRRMRRYVKE